MEEDPNALRPVDVKKRPQPGQTVYVPSRSGLDMFHGGCARVSESSTKRTIYVDEDPGWQYSWHGLQHRQMELWAEFGTRRARLATHEEIQAAKKAREDEVAAQRARTEEARRLEWEPRRYPVLNRGLMAVPEYCQHRRGKNWAALLTADPSLPGGLQRDWFNYGRGPAFYFIPPKLEVGDAVEFGADYVQGTGRKEENRWYGVVTGLGPDFLELQKCQDAAQAVLRSAQMKAVSLAGIEPATSPTPRERATTALQADESVQKAG